MVWVRTDIGYHDCSLDGASVSEEEDLDGFYKKFIELRINGMKLGSKCTIKMYGPMGPGKSHTMFGCPKQPEIVYRALRDILGGGEEGGDGGGGGFGFGQFVQVAVLEICNEEIYDLLSTNISGGGVNLGWPKGTASKVLACRPCRYVHDVNGLYVGLNSVCTAKASTSLKKISPTFAASCRRAIQNELTVECQQTGFD